MVGDEDGDEDGVRHDGWKRGGEERGRETFLRGTRHRWKIDGRRGREEEEEFKRGEMKEAERDG